MASNTFGLMIPNENVTLEVTDNDTPIQASYKNNVYNNGISKDDYFGMLSETPFLSGKTAEMAKNNVFWTFGWKGVAGSALRLAYDTTVGTVGTVYDSVITGPTEEWFDRKYKALEESKKEWREQQIMKEAIIKQNMEREGRGHEFVSELDRLDNVMNKMTYYDPFSEKMVRFKTGTVAEKSMKIDPITGEPQTILVDTGMDVDSLSHASYNVGRLRDTIFDGLGLTIDEKDNEKAAMLGQVTGSVLASVGLAKKMTAKGVGALYGLASGNNAFAEVREKGGSVNQALLYGSGVGFSIAKLEEVGLQTMLEKVAVKKVGGFLAKAFGVNAIEEMSQEVAEATIMSKWREDTFMEVVYDVFQSGIYGGLGGVLGYGINYNGIKRSKEQFKSEVREKAKPLGFTDSFIENISEAAYMGDQDSINEVVNIMNDQTMSITDSIEDGDFNRDRVIESWESQTEKAAMGVDDDSYVRILELQDRIVNRAKEVGVSANEAEANGVLLKSVVGGLVREAKEGGMSVENVLDDIELDIAYNNNLLKVVDENSVEYDLEYDGEYALDYTDSFDPNRDVQYSLGDEVKVREVRGKYSPINKTIELFKSSKPEDLTHELLHPLLNKYIDLLKKNNKTEQLNAMANAVGVTDIKNFNDAANERLVDMALNYLKTGEAPNLATESLFENSKNWVIDTVDAVRKVSPESVSPEISAFIDSAITEEELSIPDIQYLKGRQKELSQVLAAAVRGEEIITDKGMTIQDVEKLRKALYARIPRKGETLATEIRRKGGINVDSEIAPALGFDSHKGYEGGFWRKNSGFTSEDSLIEFLEEKGYLPPNSMQNPNVWDKVQDLIYNKDSAMNEANSIRQAYRENALEAQREISEMIDDLGYTDINQLEAGMKAVRQMLRSKDYDSTKQAINFAKYGLAKLSKDYERLYRQKTKDVQKMQEQYLSFINEQTITPAHKAKLLTKVKNIKDNYSNKRTLNSAADSIKSYIEQEMKGGLRRQIRDLIKSTKPASKKEQKFDYVNNVLFDKLRTYNNYTQDKALEKLNELSEKVEETGEIERLERMFLAVKGNPSSITSVALYNDLLSSLQNAIKLGSEAKSVEEFTNKMNKFDKVQNVVNAISEKNANGFNFATKAYVRGMSNIGSFINAMAGKSVAEEYDIDYYANQRDIKTSKFLNKVDKSVQDIFGLKKSYQVKDLIEKLNNSDLGTLRQVESKTSKDTLSFKMNKLEAISLYNSIKNDNMRESIYKAYGKTQIDSFIAKLSNKEKLLGDLWQKSLESLYDMVNKQYIKQFGIDMGKTENYWPSSAILSTEADVFQIYRDASSNPSFIKERTASRIPQPTNAFTTFNKFISNAFWFSEVSPHYKNLHDTFNNSLVKNKIEQTFGSDVFSSLDSRIKRLGLTNFSKMADEVSGWWDKVIVNYSRAKIAVNPSPAIGQLASMVHYVENMNTVDWVSGFVSGLFAPKKTFDYMNKYVGDFLKERFGSGYSEDISRMTKEASSISKFKFLPSTGKRSVISDIFTFLNKMVDSGAIVFGGYPRLKQLIDSGISEQEAVKKFIQESRGSQQATGEASTAPFQSQKGFIRAFTMFKNAPAQFTRKIADALISYDNGDLSAAQTAKIINLYGVVSPAIWISLISGFYELVFGDDEDDDEDEKNTLFNNILVQTIYNPFAAVPIVGDIVYGLTKKALGMNTYGKAFNMVLLDDLNKSWNKLDKEDKDWYDIYEIMTPLIEMFTGVPVKTATKYSNLIIGDDD